MREEWGEIVSDFDPAPRDPQVDSLTVPWHCKAGETVNVNPPFKHIPRRVAKILQELQESHVQNVLLIVPGRISPDWSHDVVLNYDTKAVIARNSLKFKRNTRQIPTGVLIVDLHTPLRENTRGLPVFLAKLHDWDGPSHPTEEKKEKEKKEEKDEKEEKEEKEDVAPESSRSEAESLKLAPSKTRTCLGF